MLTGSQLRAARAALGWTADRLAAEADVARRTIVRYEAADGVAPGHKSTLKRLIAVFEAQGVSFTRDDKGRVGLTIQLTDPPLD